MLPTGARFWPLTKHFSQLDETVGPYDGAEHLDGVLPEDRAALLPERQELAGARVGAGLGPAAGAVLRGLAAGRCAQRHSATAVSRPFLPQISPIFRHLSPVLSVSAPGSRTAQMNGGKNGGKRA